MRLSHGKEIISKNFRKIIFIIGKDYYKKITFLVVSSFFLSILEGIGIVSLMPIVDNIFGSNKSFFSINIYTAVALFSIVILLKFISTSLLIYFNKKFTTQILNSVSTKFYKGYLNLTYESFFRKNQTSGVQILQIELTNFLNLIESILSFISDLLIFVLVTIFLLFFETIPTLISTGVLSILLLSMFMIVNKWSNVFGNERKKADTKLSKLILETFSGFEVIKINNLINSFLAEFKKLKRKI